MPTITDAIGTWEQLGQVALSDEWQLFPSEVINGETFRLSYILDWANWENLAGYRSYGLIRFYYAAGNDIIVSTAQAIYPKQQKEAREFLIPEDFKANNFLIRSVGVKRIVKYRRPLVASPQVIPWSLSLEYLL